MNKLAVIAFTLLVFLSSMLWFLANGSLNEYLKSQLELQGHYYSDQLTQVDLADYSSSTGTGSFQKLSLLNLDNYQTKYAVLIDEAYVELVKQPSQPLLSTVNVIRINKLTLNSETRTDKKNNIKQIIKRVKSKLARDYPEQYPDIAAKIYAKNNPQLNAEEYAQNNPQAGPIVEHTETKKTRGKPQTKVIVSSVFINMVELNTINNGLVNKSILRDVKLTKIGGTQGILTNQLGGEVILALLSLASHK